MEGTMITKKNRITNNNEETKINFFDPHGQSEENYENDKFDH